MGIRVNMKRLYETVLRRLLTEAKCPQCGNPDAYVGATAVECPNPKCSFYSARQAADVKASGKGAKDPRYANIMRMNPDGSGLETFARGIRNTVGFDWDPRTQELWFTDNGRDWLGDDLPHRNELRRRSHSFLVPAAQRALPAAVFGPVPAPPWFSPIREKEGGLSRLSNPWFGHQLMARSISGTSQLAS